MDLLHLKEDLENVEYSKLRQIAKDLGLKIKKNPKASTLVKVIRRHLDPETSILRKSLAGKRKSRGRRSFEDSINSSLSSQMNLSDVSEPELMNVTISPRDRRRSVTVKRESVGKRRSTFEVSPQDAEFKGQDSTDFDKSRTSVATSEVKRKSVLKRESTFDLTPLKTDSQGLDGSSQVEPVDSAVLPAKKSSKLSLSAHKGAAKVKNTDVSKTLNQRKSILNTKTPAQKSTTNLASSKTRKSVRIKIVTPKTPVEARDTLKRISQPPTSAGHTPFVKLSDKKSNVSGIPKIANFSKTKKVSTPNFAAIHKKAFDKMDSLDTYLDKKEKRGAMMSASKKENKNSSVLGTPVATKLNIPVKQFSFKKTPVVELGLAKKMSDVTAKSNIPMKSITLKKTPIVEFGSAKRMSADAQGKPSLITKKPLSMKNVKANPALLKTKNSNRESTDVKEKSRTILKGVRMNRRFELLMKNRGINL